MIPWASGGVYLSVVLIIDIYIKKNEYDTV